MTKIWNDPAEFTEDSLAGFAMLHRRYVRQVTGGVVRRNPGADGKVVVLVGGGSGHYPAFMGWVGPGFADGAVVGNVFSAPSSQYAYSVARAADRGGGVIFAYGNHAGDVMNFGMAAEQLQHEGVDARHIIVTDDILAAPANEIEKRRGIAGDFTVFKILGAAAETGASMDEVMRLGQLANDQTRTIGIGLAGCTMPGADEPLFTVEPGMMGIGLGLHGEPGIETIPLGNAEEIARRLVEPLLEENPNNARRAAVILTGLGATKYEELFLLWREIVPLFEVAGIELVEPEVGELITSLDMAGMSLTVTWLDDELEPLWRAVADTPAFRRGAITNMNLAEVAGDDADDEAGQQLSIPPCSSASHSAAQFFSERLSAAARAIEAEETRLGQLDAIAGDGDHGRGMVRGIQAAEQAAQAAIAAGAGLGTALTLAGDAWAAHAGGTSGVLWGSGLRAAGTSLGDDAVSDAAISEAVRAFVDTMLRLGKAQLGDKTLLDAAVPFAEVLDSQIGDGVTSAWQSAAHRAQEAAEETADLEPKIGRARPNAQRSLGTPDPGAISFALVVRSVINV